MHFVELNPNCYLFHLLIFADGSLRYPRLTNIIIKILIKLQKISYLTSGTYGAWISRFNNLFQGNDFNHGWLLTYSGPFDPRRFAGFLWII
jgi:hypothetical protein